MKNKVKYDVISPDGFAIHPFDFYNTKKQAKKALTTWVKQYERQGYYSTVINNERVKISLNDLPKHCKIVPISNETNQNLTNTK